MYVQYLFVTFKLVKKKYYSMVSLWFMVVISFVEREGDKENDMEI